MSQQPPAPEPSPDEIPADGDSLGQVADYREEPGEAVRPRLPFWKRIGGEGLVVSLVLHGVLLIIFAVWVIATITDTANSDPDTFATGSGGGAKGEKAKVFEHKMQPRNAQNLARNAARITSKSATASVALPDLPVTSTPSLMTGMTGGGSSKGFGGGSGGGIGAGKGVGVGNGKNFVGLFGAKFGADGLVGTFTDLKQDSRGKATDIAGPDPANYNPANRPAIQAYVKEVHGFVTGRWSESRLRKFYQAPDKLVATQFFIPQRRAIEAPKAYGVVERVKPSRWLAHYKGRVRAPATGKFRFVGFADDILCVRWDNKLALDAGFDGPSIDAIPTSHHDDAVRTYDDFSGKPRVPLYDYHGKVPGTDIGRFRAGPWIDVTAGTTFAMEVLIGETPGGGFGCLLGIELSNGKREGGQFVGDRTVRLFKIGNGPLNPEIADGANTGWQMEPGDWTFQPASGASMAR